MRIPIPGTDYELVFHIPWSAPKHNGVPVPNPTMAQRAANAGWLPVRSKHVDRHATPPPLPPRRVRAELLQVDVGAVPFVDPRSGAQTSIDAELHHFRQCLAELPGLRKDRMGLKSYDKKDLEKIHYIVAAENHRSKTALGTVSSSTSTPLNLRCFDTPADFVAYIDAQRQAWREGESPKRIRAVVAGIDDAHSCGFSVRFLQTGGETKTVTIAVDSGDYTNQIDEHLSFEAGAYPGATSSGLLIAANTQKDGHSCRIFGVSNALKLHECEAACEAWEAAVSSGQPVAAGAAADTPGFQIVKSGMSMLPIPFAKHLQDLRLRPAMLDARGWSGVVVNRRQDGPETLPQRDLRFASDEQFSESIYAKREVEYQRVVDYLTKLKADPRGAERLGRDLSEAYPPGT